MRNDIGTINNKVFAGTRRHTKTIRFDILKNHFSQWMGEGKKREQFDYIQGQLTGISVHKREARGREISFVELHFRHGDVLFDVTSFASGSITAELFSKLVNLRNPRDIIRIDIWTKGPFINCSVYEHGERLPFRPLPKAVKNNNGIKAYFDTAERDAAVMAMIDELNARIAQVSREEVAQN